MKRLWNKLAVAASLVSQLVALPCMSAIPRTTDWSIYYIDVTRVIQPIESTQTIKSEDVAKWIPTNMQASDDGGAVAAKIVDFSIQNMMKSPEFKNNAFVRSAQKMESAMASDVSFGGSAEGETKHVIKFQMKPTQTLAQLNYQGFVTARVNYQISHETLNVEISEKIIGDTDLVLSHADTRDDRREMLSMRWNF